MATVHEWIGYLHFIGAEGGLLLDGAFLRGPGLLAALVTLSLCMCSGLVLLDAARRTTAVPSWAFLRRDVAQLAAEREKNSRALAALAVRRDELAAELDSLKSDKTELAGISRQRAEQEARLKDISQRLRSMEDDRALIDEIRAELEELTAEREALRQEIAKLRDESLQEGNAMAYLRERKADLEEAAAGDKAARLAARAETARLNRECELCQRELDARRAELTALEEKRKEAFEALEAIQRDRDHLSGEVSTMQGRVKALERERQDIERKIASAEGKRSKLIEENGRLGAERSALWLEFVSLEERRNASAREAAASEVSLRELRAHRDSLHSEIEILKRVFGTVVGDAEGLGAA